MLAADINIIIGNQKWNTETFLSLGAELNQMPQRFHAEPCDSLPAQTAKEIGSLQTAPSALWICSWFCVTEFLAERELHVKVTGEEKKRHVKHAQPSPFHSWPFSGLGKEGTIPDSDLFWGGKWAIVEVEEVKWVLSGLITVQQKLSSLRKLSHPELWVGASVCRLMWIYFCLVSEDAPYVEMMLIVQEAGLNIRLSSKVRQEEMWFDVVSVVDCRSGVHKRHLLSSKVDVEPALQDFIGHQRHSKLRRGPKHSSWRNRWNWYHKSEDEEVRASTTTN